MQNWYIYIIFSKITKIEHKNYILFLCFSHAQETKVVSRPTRNKWKGGAVRPGWSSPSIRHRGLTIRNRWLYNKGGRQILFRLRGDSRGPSLKTHFSKNRILLRTRLQNKTYYTIESFLKNIISLPPSQVSGG